MKNSRKKASAPLMSSPEFPSPAIIGRRTAAGVHSVTKDEIERFWQRKRLEEAEHLLAAEKAAARIRARSLMEDRKRYEEWLISAVENGGIGRKEAAAGEDNSVGIKDWWTKSTYAYLNQPAIKSMMEDNFPPLQAKSTYLPQYCNTCFNSAILLKCNFTSSLGAF